MVWEHYLYNCFVKQNDTSRMMRADQLSPSFLALYSECQQGSVYSEVPGTCCQSCYMAVTWLKVPPENNFQSLFSPGHTHSWEVLPKKYSWCDPCLLEIKIKREWLNSDKLISHYCHSVPFIFPECIVSELALIPSLYICMNMVV